MIDVIWTEKSHDVWTVWLDDPPQRNSLTCEARLALAEQIGAGGREPACRGLRECPKRSAAAWAEKAASSALTVAPGPTRRKGCEELMGEPMTDVDSRPFPALTPGNEFFWTAGAEGRLRFKRCQACGLYLHPPTPICPNCLSKSIAVEDVSGRGMVVTFTVNHHAWDPAFKPPYVIAIVEIEEAPYVRLTTNIVNCAPEDVRMEMPVEVLFHQVGPTWLPVFQPRAA